MKLNIEISPVLDLLVQRLKQITLEEDVEPTTPIFRKSFGGPTWDFAGYREYSPSDDASMIDWKASVRSNRTLIKQYTEIQTLNILFLVDINSSMLLGTVGKRKIDFASEVIATLSYSILKAKGEIKLALFSDSLKKPLSVNNIQQFFQIKDRLTNESLYGGRADLKNASKNILPYIKKGTYIILVTDFLNLGNDWQETILFLGSKFNLSCFMIRDPIDRALPKGVNKVLIQEPGSDRTLLLNVRRDKKKYAKRAKEQEDSIQKLLKTVNSDYLLLDTSKPYIDDLITFLERRRQKSH